MAALNCLIVVVFLLVLTEGLCYMLPQPTSSELLDNNSIAIANIDKVETSLEQQTSSNTTLSTKNIDLINSELNVNDFSTTTSIPAINSPSEQSSNYTKNTFNTPTIEVVSNSTSLNNTNQKVQVAAIGAVTMPQLPTDVTQEPIAFVKHPIDCSQREKLKKQPVYNGSARLKKCCALGESLDIYRENQSDAMCDTTNISFEPNVISAVLYDNCIEDEEVPVSLNYEIGNPCNTSFLYDSNEDNLFVLQDGSLLVIDKYGNESYAVEKNYCIDMDKSGSMFAIICITQVEEHLARGQTVTVAVLMLVSMPCLLIVSYVHISLRMLRTLNGLSLSLMSLCLASGYFVHSVVHLYNIPSDGFIGYVIQFCILSYFFWFFCLCSNVVVNIWYKLPQHVQLTKTMAYINFGIYCAFAFTGPAILVTLTVQKGLQGTPSYFIQGLTESIRESQRYFIPPVSTILALSFFVMMVSFFGFQRIKNNGYLPAEKDEPLESNAHSALAPLEFDQQKYEEVKKDAKCISLLGIIMIVTWLLEVVTFYSPGPEGYLLLCDMVNGLQGVFVLLIFLVVRRRRTIILRWWYDRGSHTIVEPGTELTTVTK